MKKSTKIYSWAWAVALVIIIGLVVWPSHHKLARDPKKVGAIVNLRLPEIADYEYDDNLNRDTSRWDYYEYHAFLRRISPRSASQRWSVGVSRIASTGAKTKWRDITYLWIMEALMDYTMLVVQSTMIKSM